MCKNILLFFWEPIEADLMANEKSASPTLSDTQKHRLPFFSTT